MRLALAAFTSTGGLLAQRLSRALGDAGHTLDAPPALFYSAAGAARQPLCLSKWTKQAFTQNDGLVFVGACGIAVRAVAPLLTDKLTDPAVVSVDEQGRFSIALVSGHVGGANRLAADIARLTGGQAVVSTATDLNERFAVDLFAQKNELYLCERTLAKQVSAAILEGDPVGFACDFPLAFGGVLPQGLVPFAASDAVPPFGICISADVSQTPFAQTLHLIPRWLVLGVGCKKGISEQAFEAAILALLVKMRLPVEAVGTVATLDRKQNEPCIVAFCQKYGLTLQAAAPEELSAQSGKFSGSEFVRRTTGVDNVCERAAVWAGADRFLVRKQAADGITLALAAPNKTMVF